MHDGNDTLDRIIANMDAATLRAAVRWLSEHLAAMSSPPAISTVAT